MHGVSRMAPTALPGPGKEFFASSSTEPKTSQVPSPSRLKSFSRSACPLMPASTEAFELRKAAPESSNDAPLPSQELERAATGPAQATAGCSASIHVLRSHNPADTSPGLTLAGQRSRRQEETNRKLVVLFASSFRKPQFNVF